MGNYLKYQCAATVMLNERSLYHSISAGNFVKDFICLTSCEKFLLVSHKMIELSVSAVGPGNFSDYPEISKYAS
jgi:hypothetical protein